MGSKILNAILRKHFHYSLFVKRIIAVEAQLYFLGLAGLKRTYNQFADARGRLKKASEELTLSMSHFSNFLSALGRNC